VEVVQLDKEEDKDKGKEKDIDNSKNQDSLLKNVVIKDDY